MQNNMADPSTYLCELTKAMQAQWPENRTINIVCHGHSVPSGYSATPMVDTFHAYPHLLHQALKDRFPFAVINVIITAIGGENAESGMKRMGSEVLCHQPDLVLIDYGLNDRGLGLERAGNAWEAMIGQVLARGVKLILLTPTWDCTETGSAGASDLWQHAGQIRQLAQQHSVGLADSYAAFQNHINNGGNLSDLLCWVNHPGKKGHELVKNELMRWFPY